MSNSVADFVLTMVDGSGSATRPRRPVDSGDAVRTEALTEALDWLCKWPPDLFGVTWAVLQRTGAYRFTECVPAGAEWPPITAWDPELHSMALAWHDALTEKSIAPLHPRTEAARKAFIAHAFAVTLEDLQHRSIADNSTPAWKLVEALLVLHAAADQAFATVGLTSVEAPGRHTLEQRKTRSRVGLVASLLLATNGTLSRLPKHLLTVLPKLRTPQRGLSVRTLSHHLCVYAGEVNAIWRCVPFLGLREHSLNLMVVPHPVGFSARRFRIVRNASFCRRAKSEGFFAYTCELPVDLDELMASINQAEQEVGPLDMIALPEMALNESELHGLRDRLSELYVGRSRIPSVLTGIRDDREHVRAPVRTRTGDIDECASSAKAINELAFCFFFAGKWYESRQQKHHRWCLDESQLRQYGLAGLLPAKRLWWESFDVGRRNQSFLMAAPWLCIAPLICEDLAQQDPLADLVRSVGPQLVTALLMDGPQLPHRWPGRYASVLADDPGCAVLTLTSAGIAAHSRVEGSSVAPSTDVSVALWKDAVRGWREVKHQTGDKLSYHVMTMSASFREEFTSDGRSDRGATPALTLEQCRSVELPVTIDGSGPSRPIAAPPVSTATDESERRVKLDLEELTRLIFALDHMVQHPEDADDVATLLRVHEVDTDAPVLRAWFPRNTEPFNEVLQRSHARTRERERRLPKAAVAASPVTLTDVIEMAARSFKACGVSGRGDDAQTKMWTTLLTALRTELHSLDSGIETRGTLNGAESTKALDQARAKWLVAEAIQYLIRARLDTPRMRGHASTEQRRALHEIEDQLHDGSMVPKAMWTRITNATSSAS